MKVQISPLKSSLCSALLLSVASVTVFYQTGHSSSTINVAKQQSNKVISVYLLIDKPETLEKYVQDLSRVKKPNFNRVIFSFVKPTLIDYIPGSLANTGILGYFDRGDGKGVNAFNQLKEAVELSKYKNIQPFLSVGGWNYSCNFKVMGTNCGAAPTPENGIHYDWFPDPKDPDKAKQNAAKKSYANLVKLTSDLGMQGIDFDYEEFWHADANAKPWGGDPWATQLAKDILSNGGPTYDVLMKYGTESGSTFVMPKTIDKVDAILHEITDNPSSRNLLLATAAPPVGARPITGFVYGDNATDIYTLGGVWWKGNLKGLWYHLAEKDPKIVNRFDSLGLMTYDLCGDNPTVCAPYGGGPLNLPGQVLAYMKDYSVWLKAPKTEPASLTVDQVGKVKFLPAHYQVKPKVQFGFEVNQPAYPKNPAGQLQLTNQLVNQITNEQKNSSGVIIWQMYSEQNKNVKDSTTTKYTINKSCKVFLQGDNRYDCSADFPGE